MSLADSDLAKRLQEDRKKMAEAVQEKDAKLQAMLQD